MNYEKAKQMRQKSKIWSNPWQIWNQKWLQN